MEYAMRKNESRDQRLLSKLEDAESRLSPGQRTAAYRRKLVWLAAAGLVPIWASVGGCLALAPSDTAMYVTFASIGVFLATGAYLFGRLFAVTGGGMSMPDHLLDERQSAERLQARAIAHKITFLLVAGTAVAVLLIMPDRGDMAEFPGAAVSVLFMALLFTMAVLPTLILAWRQPGDDSDD